MCTHFNTSGILLLSVIFNKIFGTHNRQIKQKSSAEIKDFTTLN